MIKTKNDLIEILILIGTIFLLLYSTDPIEYPDSNRYLAGSFHDPPLYSSIILLTNLVFDSLNFVIILQTFFIGFALIYFVRTVSDQFNLDLITKILVSLFLFLPVIQFYRHLLTEPFSYAFSLFFVSFVFRLIFNFNYLNLFWSSFFVILLLLMRNQFLFLYAVILVLYFGIYFLNSSKKTFSYLIISFLSILLIHNSLVSLNKSIFKIQFKSKDPSNSSIYFFTLVDAVYISDREDIKLFKDKKLKKTLADIFEEMNKRKALSKYYDGRGHFGQSLQHIRNYSLPLIKDLAVEKNISPKILQKKISAVLIQTNFNLYLRHIFKKFYDSSWLFVFVPFFMLLPSLISFIKNKSHLSLIIIFLSSFGLANHTTIYLFGRVQPRYLIYSDFIILIFILISFTILLKRKK